MGIEIIIFLISAQNHYVVGTLWGSSNDTNILCFSQEIKKYQYSWLKVGSYRAVAICKHVYYIT